MEELTTEQLELQNETLLREKLRYDIRLGKALDKLKKTPEFKELFEETFIEKGKSILWDNIRHLTEEQLKGRGNDRNLEVIELIKGQVKSRLDFEGFLDTVEHDAINAQAELEELDRETA